MAQLTSLNRLILRRVLPSLQARLVSTSKKNNDTIAADVCKTTVNAKPEEKNWMSYGFEVDNKEDDRRAMHSSMFAGVTLCMVVVGEEVT